MTTRCPRAGLSAVSRLCIHHYHAYRLIAATPILLRIPQKRRYTQTHAKRLPPPDNVKSAFDILSTGAKHDPLNPPRSTLPPALTLPTRGNENAFIYLFNLGRAYGRFYKDGVKAVYYNWKAARALWDRLAASRGVKKGQYMHAVHSTFISRSDYQVLIRNDRDIGKLPFFGVLVLIFGEWLPLVVPFIPDAVPSTCRIPKQLRQMQEKNEARRHKAMERGVSEPDAEQWSQGQVRHDVAQTKLWPAASDGQYMKSVIDSLRPDQLYHLSCTLGLHKHFWDRLQMPPPSFILRRVILDRVIYLAQDDWLILTAEAGRHINDIIGSLSPDEIRIAVAERGFDVLGNGDDYLRGRLKFWLHSQTHDRGHGRAMFNMLFGRHDLIGTVNPPAQAQAQAQGAPKSKKGKKGRR